jgi:LmbE family N-acetylglucosaminyl deacetylase
MPNYYVDVAEYIDQKIEAYNCYKTEKRNYPHPRSEEALKVIAQKRGVEIGFSTSEAFVILRGKWELGIL